MKDYKFSQVLLESQEIKSVVRVVADRILKMMSRKVEKTFEEKWFCIHFSYVITLTESLQLPMYSFTIFQKMLQTILH